MEFKKTAKKIFKKIFKQKNIPISIIEETAAQEYIADETEQQTVEPEIHIQTICDLYDEYKETLEKAIELGKEDKLVLNPEIISLPATQKCNIRCIMCFVESNNYHLTVEETKELLSVPDKASKVVAYGKIKTIDLTSREAFLNPELHMIVKELKSIYPDAEISNITNATIKIQGNVAEALKYIDHIGISVDGATKETFEFIRRGADFFKVIKNIQDIVKLKGADNEKITIAFVAMTINIHELPKLVKLAYYLDIKYIFVQRMEIRSENQNEVSEYQLIQMPKDEVQQIIDESKEEMIKLNRYISFTNLIPQENITEGIGPEKDDKTKITMTMCKYLWKTAPYLGMDEAGLFIRGMCCHMPDSEYSNVENKNLLRNKYLFDIFNSDLYWNKRSDLFA